MGSERTTVLTASAAQPFDRVASMTSDRLTRVVVEHHRLSVAGLAVDLMIDAALAPLIVPTFSHLSSANVDSPALGIKVARLNDDDAAAFELATLSEAGALHSIDEGDVIMHALHDSLALLNRRDGTLHVLLRESRETPTWHQAKPLQVPLSIFLADCGIDLLHGGLVSLNGRGVLFTGASGSGKSTASLASLADGFDFLGDDCVAMKHQGARFNGYSVFASGCLHPDHLRRFTALDGRGLDAPVAPNEKVVLSLNAMYADRVVASTEIRAIVLPSVTHAPSVTIRPASAREALLALAPGSILKRATPAAMALKRMSVMVRELPCFRLEMGPVREIGSSVRELLEGIA